MISKYTLLVKSDDGKGYFYVPIKIEDTDEQGFKIARFLDSLTVAKDMQRAKNEKAA